ncbi:MAG: UDP-N-acetylmuramate:L-alanyl-gamma-D-glutamyl-meso-diaminopimelate ligase [Gammaproteobacteria bacterium]|nr:UDP-N-acetylmuramate:L-alanyl-gamma-D-glutamyl-meso-diaminopimelate ligase [Gammaproteobacteria bacterium]MYD02922.1 UDP-N-acetylmuramate:L-alanyl-gamma-D-glutamyl-meso-diaminopimelate ligase [Gammaproteobacteria bacterium]MYI26025.1 UDP-N-acetylmuramate:L-alanyl-gamma-D-glutamyl-meso-diaminopimelate ligase [Gammaproteobacteria bacterium]
MHIHILGICGTFMGGLAALARELGHEVTGADRAAWPPMSTRLRELGIEPVIGFDPAQLEAEPDLVLVGNVMSRGMPIVEALLDSGLDYLSGPEWLGAQVLPGREVIAVTGTHGKTTTSGMVAWLLREAGLEPGFLIGGAPGNFDRTARLGSGRHFVIEGDEYDTAFFDKNAKFLHYRARTVIINNIEHDHADIYADVDAVLRQFHLLLRRTPGGGRLIVNGADGNIARLLEQGCWTAVERFSAGSAADATADWRAERVEGARARFHCASGEAEGVVELPGPHNLSNALAALAAAHRAGVDLERACRALGGFRPPARRLQLVGRYGADADIALYDDFAHHPTAIRLTLESLKQDHSRVLAVFEPASNSMRSGAHLARLPAALDGAEHVWLVPSGSLQWDPAAAFAGVSHVTPCADAAEAAQAAAASVHPGDAVVFMSNSGASGGAQLLAAALSK